MMTNLSHCTGSIRRASGLLLATFLALVTGCGHYQMGVASHEHGPLPKKIYVDWVENETFEPEQIVPYTQAIREMIIESGQFTLSGSPVEADAILGVSLNNFDRFIQANRSDDTGLALKYRNMMTATFSLYGNADGQVFIEEQEISISADALASQGLQAAEFQQTDTMARYLANRVRDAMYGLGF